MKKEEIINDYKTCQDVCNKNPNCQWFSYKRKIELCIHWATCPTQNADTDYVSSQSECSDSHNELDDPKLDNHELDNPYKCNQTGMCLVSHYTCRKVSSRSKSLLVACLVLKHPKKV